MHTCPGAIAWCNRLGAMTVSCYLDILCPPAACGNAGVAETLERSIEPMIAVPHCRQDLPELSRVRCMIHQSASATPQRGHT